MPILLHIGCGGGAGCPKPHVCKWRVWDGGSDDHIPIYTGRFFKPDFFLQIAILCVGGGGLLLIQPWVSNGLGPQKVWMC